MKVTFNTEIAHKTPWNEGHLAKYATNQIKSFPNAGHLVGLVGSPFLSFVTSGDTKVKIICKGQCQISRSSFQS